MDGELVRESGVHQVPTVNGVQWFGRENEVTEQEQSRAREWASTFVERMFDQMFGVR